jgi:hypothetical protein
MARPLTDEERATIDAATVAINAVVQADDMPDGPERERVLLQAMQRATELAQAAKHIIQSLLEQPHG